MGKLEPAWWGVWDLRLYPFVTMAWNSLVSSVRACSMQGCKSEQGAGLRHFGNACRHNNCIKHGRISERQGRQSGGMIGST